MEGENRQQQDQQPRPMKQAVAENRPLPNQKCPRCDSVETKFCYFNNYNTAQPRYFCKNCRRYWTQGGTLRNVPFGGGCRRGKRARGSSSSSGENFRTLLSSPQLPQSHSGGNFSGLPVVNMPQARPYFSGGGGFMAAMQSFNRPQQATYNQPPLNFGGGGSSNLAILQGFNNVMNPFMESQNQSHPATQPNGQFYQIANSDQGMLAHQQPNRPLGSWTRAFLNHTTNSNPFSDANTTVFWDSNNSINGASGAAGSSSAEWPGQLGYGPPA